MKRLRGTSKFVCFLIPFPFGEGGGGAWVRREVLGPKQIKVTCHFCTIKTKISYTI